MKTVIVSSLREGIPPNSGHLGKWAELLTKKAQPLLPLATPPHFPIRGFYSLSLEHMGFPGGSVVQNPPASTGDMSREDPLEKEMATRKRNGNPLQYSCLENPIERRAWHGVTWCLWGHKRVRHHLAAKQQQLHTQQDCRKCLWLNLASDLRASLDPPSLWDVEWGCALA